MGEELRKEKKNDDDSITGPREISNQDLPN
jgi:hypothetical protein